MTLPTAAPEAHGIPSSAVLDFVDAAEKQIDALHSFMLLRHGHILAQGWWSPYRPDRPHMLFSVSKSFTSTAVGLAVAEGLLSVDDPVSRHLPGAPAALRIRHLLTMTTGHAEDTVEHLDDGKDGDWARAFFAQPFEHEPGTHFVYNSGATYILSVIMQQVTGVTLLDYLRPRLLDPLGIGEATWETCPRGINSGGWGLNLRTEDVARFGQLYLQGGAWHGQQIVPAAWVREATAFHVSNAHNEEIDWSQGYGYQFWRCRHGAYRGDGAFGQFCVVMRDQDAVLVTTGGLRDMHAVLDLVWEHLLPAMGPAPLPSDHAATARLDERLASLRLPPVPGQTSSPAAARVTGQTYQLDGDGTATLHVAADGCRLVLADDRGEHELHAGHGEWRLGTTTMRPGPAMPVAVSGAWTSDDTYVMRACAYETPFVRTLTLRFEGANLTLTNSQNVSFGPTEFPPVTGRLSPSGAVAGPRPPDRRP